MRGHSHHMHKHPVSWALTLFPCDCHHHVGDVEMMPQAGRNEQHRLDEVRKNRTR